MINDFKIKVNNGENINYIYHISDIHIRTGNNEQSRYNEYLYVFKNLKKTIKSNNDLKQSILIITGDIFHHKNLIESSGIELFSFLIKELSFNISNQLIINSSVKFHPSPVVPQTKNCFTCGFNQLICF